MCPSTSRGTASRPLTTKGGSDYTTGALEGLQRTIDDGIDVRGYLHWSALDNYEWGSYEPTFGLIAFDKQTFERTAKPSLAWLGAVARDHATRKTMAPALIPR